MTLPVLIHVLSLDTIGGVETLYAHFLEEALARGTAVHHTSVCGKPPNKKLLMRFEKIAHTPFLEEHVMGVRLPRFLRGLVHIRRGMVEEIAKPSAWVFWNRIEDSIPTGTTIYYEHGAAWNVPITKNRTKFLQHSSKIVANSHAAALVLKEKWHVDAPICVVPNPLRPDLPISEISRSLQSTNSIRLGLIGRLVPVKGLFVALHTLKVLVDRGINATLSIAGVGQLESMGRRFAEKLGLSSFVTWRGCVESVTDFYDSIDLLLVPSIREPLGLVSLEAAARGVPVIAAAVDGLPEAVIDGKTGLCIAPTISLASAKELLPSMLGVPEVVVNPITKSLQEPKVLDPAHLADAIELQHKETPPK